VHHPVDGDLTIYTAAEQKAKLLPAFRSPYSIVELDLAQVREIDTAGMQLLILGCRVTVAVGSALRLTQISPGVASLIELLELEQTFERARDHCPVCASSRIHKPF
jgi:anti-anti-sigma factor